MLCNRCPNVMDVRRSGIYTLSLKASVGVFTLGERSIRTRGGTAATLAAARLPGLL